MDTITITAWVCITLALMLLSKGLSAALRCPLPTVQLVLGILAAGVVTVAGVDSGLRWQGFHDLVVYLLLPFLIFNAALHLRWQRLRPVLGLTLLLAIVGVVVTTALVATAVYYGIGHPTGFPVMAAVICGVLLAATDPAAVTSQANGSTAADILEGESLFNDGTAVALFTAAVGLALGSIAGANSPGEIFRYVGEVFATEFLGGALFGLIAGGFASFIARRVTAPSARAWLLLLVALAIYHAAIALHVSGIISVLVAGLLIGRHRSHDDFLKILDDSANGFLFLLAGFTITWSMFADRWLAMLIAIGAVLAARTITVGVMLRLFARRLEPPLTQSDRTTISLMGLRGAVTLALVLTLPVELPYWWTVQSMVYGVVVFDFLVLAPLAPLITRSR